MDERDPEQILQPAAVRVRDPVSGRSVWLAGMVQEMALDADVLAFTVVLTAAHDPEDGQPIAEAIVANLRAQGFDGEIRPSLARPARAEAAPAPGTVPGMSGPGLAPHGGPIVKGPIPGVKHVVAVASGKGGVGKSTVASNLAIALRKRGLRVGLVDADIHGPSVPVMMNVSSRPSVLEDGRAVPPSAYGVKCMSMGLLVDPTEAMMWRGPMVMGVLRQFLQQTAWDDLDVLLVDLPPGTGDAQLTLIQAVELSGAVVVTTPQPVALADAVRGLEMFRRLGVPLLGVVENMAWYVRPDGTRDPVFGEGGGVRVARDFGAPLLAQIPLQTAVRRAGDDGLPIALGDGEVATLFHRIAAEVARQLGLAA